MATGWSSDDDGGMAIDLDSEPIKDKSQPIYDPTKPTDDNDTACSQGKDEEKTSDYDPAEPTLSEEELLPEQEDDSLSKDQQDQLSLFSDEKHEDSNSKEGREENMQEVEGDERDKDSDDEDETQNFVEKDSRDLEDDDDRRVWEEMGKRSDRQSSECRVSSADEQEDCNKLERQQDDDTEVRWDSQESSFVSSPSQTTRMIQSLVGYSSDVSDSPNTRDSPALKDLVKNKNEPELPESSDIASEKTENLNEVNSPLLESGSVKGSEDNVEPEDGKVIQEAQRMDTEPVSDIDDNTQTSILNMNEDLNSDVPEVTFDDSDFILEKESFGSDKEEVSTKDKKTKRSHEDQSSLETDENKELFRIEDGLQDNVKKRRQEEIDSRNEEALVDLFREESDAEGIEADLKQSPVKMKKKIGKKKIKKKDGKKIPGEKKKVKKGAGKKAAAKKQNSEVEDQRFVEICKVRQSSDGKEEGEVYRESSVLTDRRNSAEDHISMTGFEKTNDSDISRTEVNEEQREPGEIVEGEKKKRLKKGEKKEKKKKKIRREVATIEEGDLAENDSQFPSFLAGFFVQDDVVGSGDIADSQQEMFPTDKDSNQRGKNYRKRHDSAEDISEESLDHALGLNSSQVAEKDQEKERSSRRHEDRDSRERRHRQNSKERRQESEKRLENKERERREKRSRDRRHDTPKEKERDRSNRDKERERDRSHRDRDRERESGREREKESGRDRDRSDRRRVELDERRRRRSRSRSREGRRRSQKSRTPERSRNRRNKSRSRDRSGDRERERDRTRERDRSSRRHRDRSHERESERRRRLSRSRSQNRRSERGGSNKENRDDGSRRRRRQDLDSDSEDHSSRRRVRHRSSQRQRRQRSSSSSSSSSSDSSNNSSSSISELHSRHHGHRDYRDRNSPRAAHRSLRALRSFAPPSEDEGNNSDVILVEPERIMIDLDEIEDPPSRVDITHANTNDDHTVDGENVPPPPGMANTTRTSALISLTTASDRPSENVPPLAIDDDGDATPTRDEQSDVVRRRVGINKVTESEYDPAHPTEAEDKESDSPSNKSRAPPIHPQPDARRSSPSRTVAKSSSQTEQESSLKNRPPIVDMFQQPPLPAQSQVQQGLIRLPNLSTPPPNLRQPWSQGLNGPGAINQSPRLKGVNQSPHPISLLGDPPVNKAPFAQENIQPNVRPALGPLAQLTSLLPALEKANLAAQQAQNKIPLSTNSTSNVSQSLDHRLGIKPLGSEALEDMDLDLSPGEDDCELELPSPDSGEASDGRRKRKRENKSTVNNAGDSGKKQLVQPYLKALSKVIEKLTPKAQKAVRSQRSADKKQQRRQSDKLEVPEDDVPTSAVELTNKERMRKHQLTPQFMKKLQFQERVIDEVKTAVKPFYASKKITKEQYKLVLRKAVPKICHSKGSSINPQKIQKLVEDYVLKMCKDNKSGGKKKKLSTPNKDKVFPSPVKHNGIKKQTTR